MTKLMHVEILPERLEQHLQTLVDGIEDLNATEARLGLDVRNLVDVLGRHRHNDDRHHKGETVLEHVRWVVEDVRYVTKQEGIRDRRQILSVVALLHDLGKGYTYELIDGKHTFRKHAEVSVRLTREMLWELRRDDPATYDRIEDLVRLHDAFMRLIEARQTAKDLKYLNWFLRDRIFPDGVHDLIWFSTADGMRAERFLETRDRIDLLMKDVMSVMRDRADERERKARWAEPPPQLLSEVETLLRVEAPDVLPQLPDLKAVNRELGSAKRYDLLTRVRQLVEGTVSERRPD